MSDYNGNHNQYGVGSPPTTEYVGKRDLPVLNSERKEFTNKIIQLEQEKDLIYASVLRKITGIVNRADFMSDEVKNELLKLIWEK